MILAAALALALGTQTDPMQFQRGNWSGQCYRERYLAGMDHELCRARIFVDTGAALERSAEGLSVEALPGNCDGGEPAYIPSAMLNGTDRAAFVADFITYQITAVVKACHAKRPIPTIREADIAAFLRASDGLKPGSFVPLDPAVRAPAAAKCGKQLEEGWRAGIKSSPFPSGGRVSLMMYTFSKKGPERAEIRFAARSEMMEDYFAMYTGPGGAMMIARKPAEVWRDPPAEWFTALCDIGIEGWSSFVELGLYPKGEGTPSLCVVRAATGVAESGGFVITQQPLIGAPQK